MSIPQNSSAAMTGTAIKKICAKNSQLKATFAKASRSTIRAITPAAGFAWVNAFFGEWIDAMVRESQSDEN